MSSFNALPEILPAHPALVYIFDVDGTLTPHAGDDAASMWYLQEEYVHALSEDEFERSVDLISKLPPRIILISRNYETVIMNFFAALDPTFPDRIDRTWSSFRRSGLAPTHQSKRDAFEAVGALPGHIIYIDDSAAEIERFQMTESLMNRSKAIKIQSWLGEDETYADVVQICQSYCAAIP